ncbi:uncharacterized protein V6R79_006949 [Siganus canaliculatus]
MAWSERESPIKHFISSMFSPPLHRQRHQFVIDFVTKNKPRRVVDLGCGECSLLKKLKFHREVELLVGVDIDGGKVKKRMHDLAPMSTDYLQPSFDKLCVELYQGSVTEKDVRLRAFDLVTSIELIEHLSLADVERFSEVVFGYMTPVAVIVSTPNSDFNPLLPGLKGFRHSDHKFEWTRAEFQSWALDVCLLYGYEATFTGVGQAPPGHEDGVGFCSQIAVFHRLGGRNSCNNLFGDDAEDVFSYTLLYSINYPSLKDNNVLRRVVVSEVLYWAEKLTRSSLEEDTDGGAEGLRSEQRMVQTQTAACGAETESLNVEQRSRDVTEAEEEAHEEVFLTNGRQQQEPCKLHRCVSVPLAVLWSCCPKVSSLTGSVRNLQHLLMDEPQVRMSQDGSAVLVQEHGLEEDDDLEDGVYAEAGQSCSHGAEQDVDWEANV